MKSKEPYYLSSSWYEPEMNAATMEEASIAKEEFRWLFQDIAEDFLSGRSHESMPFPSTSITGGGDEPTNTA